MSSDNSQCTSEVNRAALNQVSGWVECERIKELERKLCALNSIALSDWMEYDNIILPVQPDIGPFVLFKFRSVEQVKYLPHNYPVIHCGIPTSCSKIKQGDFIRYYGSINDEQTIDIHINDDYVRVIIWNINEVLMRAYFTVTRERGDALIAYIDKERNEHANQ